jgi:hypothetical protein
MFKNLTDYSYKRNLIEAIGFYLAYILLILLLVGLISALADVFLKADAAVNSKILWIVSIIACLGLSLMILIKKGQLGHIGYLLIAILSVCLSVVSAIGLGGLLGLIPVTYLSTVHPKKKTAKKKAARKKTKK